MNTEESRLVKAFRIVILLLIWFALGTSAKSFALGNFLLAAITFAIAGTLTFILIDRRLLKKLNGRPIPVGGLLAIYILVAVLVYDSVRELQQGEMFILGKVYLPELIGSLNAIVTFVLAAMLLWETVALTRQYFTSKK